MWGLVSYPWGDSTVVLIGEDPYRSPTLNNRAYMSSMFSITFFFRKGSSSILLRLKNDWRLNHFSSLLSWVPGVFSRDTSRTAAGRHVKTVRLASLNVKAKGAILLIFLSVDSAAMHDDTALVTRSEVFLDPHTKELVRGDLSSTLPFALNNVQKSQNWQGR